MSAADRINQAQNQTAAPSTDAPAPSTQEASAPAPAPSPAPANDNVTHKSRFVKMREHFAAQRKVPVRLQEDQFVQVNGYSFAIKGKERVMVPEQIYDMLVESGLA
jgi:hypothetical protein